MVALYLDIPILDSAARAAQLLELLCQGGQFCLATYHPIDNCYGFPSAPFAVAHHARDAVILLRRYLIGGGYVALALFIGFSTRGAGIDSASVSGIDEPVWHQKYLPFMSFLWFSHLCKQRGVL